MLFSIFVWGTAVQTTLSWLHRCLLLRDYCTSFSSEGFFFLSFSQTYWESCGARLLPYALLLSQMGGSSLCRPKPLLKKSSSWVYSSYQKLTMCHSFRDHRLKRKQWATRCWKSPLFLDSVHEAILCLDRWDFGCVNTYTYPHTRTHILTSLLSCCNPINMQQRTIEIGFNNVHPHFIDVQLSHQPRMYLTRRLKTKPFVTTMLYQKICWSVSFQVIVNDSGTELIISSQTHHPATAYNSWQKSFFS